MPNRLPKILAFNGSHRSENGFTEIVLKKFVDGAASAGANCEVLYPSKMNIHPCISCGKCLFETPGSCKLHDDMGSIVSKMDKADVLVFASPVYFGSMTSNLKKVFERLRSTLGAFFEFKNGRTYHRRIHKKEQEVVTIFTAGNPEEESFDSISRIFGRIIDNMEWRSAGEFHFPASHLLVTEPQRVARQLKAVARCGGELVSEGAIRKESLDAANRAYIDDPASTAQQMTQMISTMIKENEAAS